MREVLSSQLAPGYMMIYAQRDKRELEVRQIRPPANCGNYYYKVGF